MKQFYCVAILTTSFVLPVGNRLVAEDLTASSIARLSSDLKYLSADDRDGRGVDTEGIVEAGTFIAERFAELGFKTDLFNGSPFQEFTIPGDAIMGEQEHNSLVISGQTTLELVAGTTFTPLSLGSNGAFKGKLVFGGYGISAPELNYDDYADIDVAGKVVLILRKEPQQSLESSKFDGTQSSQYSYFSTKEANAAMHHAAALIIVNDSVSAAGEAGDRLFEVSGGGRALNSSQIPTFHVLREVVDPLVVQATGKSLEAWEKSIDENLQPVSCELGDFEVKGEAKVVTAQVPVRNVLGILPGTGELAEEYLVVGAHYDHVGMGGPGSLAPGTFEVHNGADDNGSGTVALLETARRLSASQAESRRSILFIAFTAEEKGLLGSKYYVSHPLIPIEQTVAMVNLDMVGRLADNTLTVYGTGTAVGFDALVDEANHATQMILNKQPAGLGPSDHQSFYEVGVPVFHFFTGLHNDYHRPSDDFETVNLDGIAKIAEMVTQVTTSLATASQRPELIQIKDVAQVGATRQRSQQASLGIRLNGESDDCLVESVEAGSGAEAAGLASGDQLIQIGETTIDKRADLFVALRQRKPGEEVKVVVLRGGEKRELNITLGRR